MKKLKLFPKIFIYTLALLLLITMLASGTIYLFAPMMGENSVLSEGTYIDGMSSAIKTAAIPRNTEIAHTILRSLPYTVAICIVVSLLCAYFFSKAITNPIKGILDATNHMAVLDRKAACKTATNDEIGILANQINQLYQNLLSTIEHLQEEKDKVSEAEKQKIDFLRSASHELKTPLTSISGYAEIMMNGLVRPEDIPRFSETIYKEARRLLTLIEDIIKISKLDDESVELEKEDVDLFELTREIVSRLSLTAAQRNIHMELTGESVKIHGIRQILDEMIYNITENAVKYNKENGNVTIWVGNTLEGPKVRVSDTGIGIPKEHQDRIFERFYRVDKSHSKERGGTGLGLSIVKHGAILHGAKVQVDSEYGKGTRMEIIFPEK